MDTPSNIPPKAHLVFLVAGKGGHFQQLMNFFEQSESHRDLSQFNYFVISDDPRLENWATERCVKFFFAPDMSVETKYRTLTSLIRFLGKFISIFRNGLYLTNGLRPSAVIGFGPFISIPIFLSCRILGVKKLICFETRSRFESISNTTRVANFFGCEVLVQNKSLNGKLKGSHYFGRL